MHDSIKVCAALSVAEDVWAFVIVAGDFEQGLKIDSIDDGGLDVGAGESYEADQKPIQRFFDIVANLAGFIIVEDRILRIALAKDAAIGEFSEIAFDGQAANETVVRQLGTFQANVFLFLRDLVNNDVSNFADIVAADGAFVGNRGSTQVTCANKREQGQPDSKI
jgi:hypothetical protein